MNLSSVFSYYACMHHAYKILLDYNQQQRIFLDVNGPLLARHNCLLRFSCVRRHRPACLLRCCSACSFCIPAGSIQQISISHLSCCRFHLLDGSGIKHDLSASPLTVLVHYQADVTQVKLRARPTVDSKEREAE